MHSYFGVGYGGLHVAAVSGKWRYLNFCQLCGLQPPPLVESMFLRFAAYLASSGLSYQTGRLYLRAVRRLQILCMGRDPLLERRSLHRCPVSKKLRPHLPITPAILQKIFQFWLHTPHQCEYILLWAAICLEFFFFFLVSCAQTSSLAHQCQLLLLIY